MSTLTVTEMARLGGLARARHMTPEERSAHCRAIAKLPRPNRKKKPKPKLPSVETAA